MTTPPELHPPIIPFEPFAMSRVPEIRQARINRALAYYLSKEPKPRKKSSSKPPKPIVLPPHLAALPPEIRDQVIASLKERKLL